MNKAGGSVPLYFITGFLGSGKTTLLNHILDEANSRGKKLGVIINEWGQVSIDASLVRARDIEIEELNNGQVFCSCLQADFVKVLGLYAQRSLDAVVVETSGMANPFPLRKLLLDLERMTGQHYVYQGMTALVDPENFLDLLGVINAVEEQIIASQRIIINKIDLADGNLLPQIREKIRRLNRSAQIIETSHARFEGFFDHSEAAVETAPAGLGPVVQRQTQKPYPRPGNHVIKTSERLTEEKAIAFVRAVLPGSLRVKGILHAESGGWFYVDGVNERVQVSPLEATGTESKIVIIPKAGEDLAERARRAWETECRVSFSMN